MKKKEMKKGLSRRDWFRAAAAGAGLLIIHPAKSVAAPISMRPAEHWEPLEEKK